MSFIKILSFLSKPVYFGQFKRVGIEAVFAINTAITNVLFTNIVSFSNLDAKISLAEFEFSSTLPWVQFFEISMFNLLFIYILSVYWILSFSDPGRVPDHEKKHLTERFTRLHKELIL